MNKNMNNDMVQFDRIKLNELKKAYEKATEDGLDQFEFYGYVLLVSYAKYVIEYLDLNLAP